MPQHDVVGEFHRNRALATAAVLVGGWISLTVTALFRLDREPMISAAIGAAMLAAAVVVTLGRDRLSESAVFVIAVPGLIVSVGVLIVSTGSDALRVMDLSLLIGMGAYVGWYFGTSRRRALYLGALFAGMVGCVVAAGASAVDPPAVFWAGTTVATLGAVVAVAIVRLREREQQLSWRDSLTDALNRRGLDCWGQEHRRRRRSAPDTAMVVIMDLDDFKAINDQHGHAAGDAVLAEFARTWLSSIRRTDAFARIGGDEFVAILPGVGPVDAQTVIARVARATGIRFSVGTTSAVLDDDLDEALRRADADLYRAKGRRSRPGEGHPEG